jgi:hypothetical protein
MAKKTTSLDTWMVPTGEHNQCVYRFWVPDKVGSADELVAFLMSRRSHPVRMEGGYVRVRNARIVDPTPFGATIEVEGTRVPTIQIEVT